MQTPLTFFLELLAIAMLVAGGGRARVLKREVVRPLVVVLDDSYSMLARLSRRRSATRRASERPRPCGDELARRQLRRPDSSWPAPSRGCWASRCARRNRPATYLAQWTCQSPWADLPRAMALAAEVGGPAARILVLSDHAPAMALDSGQMQWWAFGAKLPNMAFTAATRTPLGDNERVLLEVANLSGCRRPDHVDPRRRQPGLAARERRRVGRRRREAVLPESSRRIAAAAGNARRRRPGDRQPGAAAARVGQAACGCWWTWPTRACGRRSCGRWRPRAGRRGLGAARADRSPTSPVATDGDAWRLEILGGKDAVAYAGPFVVDHNHPLAQGLSLQNAIWSGRAADATLSGLPIVTAGNVTLMSDSEDVAGRHRLQMRFAADLSNLQDMPDWPILFANLLRWRRGRTAGHRPRPTSGWARPSP